MEECLAIFKSDSFESYTILPDYMHLIPTQSLNKEKTQVSVFLSYAARLPNRII